jgi:signal transduction histidine kinase
MKPNVSVSVWTDLYHGGLLRWALWLLALPAATAVFVMLLWPERGDGTSYQGLRQLDRWIEPLPKGSTFDEYGFRSLLKRKPDFAGAKWSATALPDVSEPVLPDAVAHNNGMARAWYRFRFQVPTDASPVETWALYGTRVQGGAYSIWVNGHLVKSMHNDWRGQWMSPPFVTVPLIESRPGQFLEVLIAIPYRLSEGYAIGSFYFGKSHELRPLRDVREFFHRTLPLMSLILVGLMGAFSLMLWTQRRTEREHLWLALLSLAVMLCNLQFTYDFSADLQVMVWYRALVDSATAWLLLLFVIFVLRFRRIHRPVIETGLACFTLVMALATTPMWDWRVNGIRAHHYALLAMYLLVACWLTWRAAKLRSLDQFLFCTAMWFFLLSGWHDLTFLTSHSNPDAIFIFPYGAFMLFVVAEVLMQRRYADALGQIEANNLHLAARLRQREAEVLAQQGSLLQAQRQRALTDERDRLIQEIHDGIGSVLMNSLTSLQRERPPPAAAQQAVQSCLEEVSLIADSLAPNVGTVGELIDTFVTRWEDRLARAGLQLRHSVADAARSWPLLPAHALDLMRIVQEAVTNALKHADAKTIELVASTDEQHGLRIDIQDDGSGFDLAANSRGRGLKHMASRVARMGGQLVMKSAPGRGVHCAIAVPAGPAPDASGV